MSSPTLEATQARIRGHQKAVAVSIETCRRALRVFASYRTQTQDVDVTMDTSVVFQGRLWSMRDVCDKPPGHLIFKGDQEAEELVLLHYILRNAHARIAEAWFGYDGILRTSVTALLAHATDGATDSARVMAGLVEFGVPDLDDNLDFLADELGLDAGQMASSARAFQDAFHAGTMDPLIQGHVGLFSMDTFTYDPCPRASAESLTTRNLFHILEIYETIDTYRVVRLRDALKLGVAVYRYENVFEELALEDD